MTTDLYAIVRASDGAFIWAGATTPENAQDIAAMAAINGHGVVNLLNGADLAAHIMQRNNG